MKILLFGITRDIVGRDTLEGIPFSQAESIGQLRDLVGRKYPELKELSSLAFAVNEAYANDDTRIQEGDEVALIPPVSGG